MEEQISRDMPKVQKYLYYATVLLGNMIVNKLPSRHLRKWFYQLLGAKIGNGTVICRRGIAEGCISQRGF